MSHPTFPTQLRTWPHHSPKGKGPRTRKQLKKYRQLRDEREMEERSNW